MNNTETLQLSIGDLIYAAKKRWKLILLTTIVGLIIGAALTGVSYLQGAMTKNYNIEASAVITAAGESGKFKERDQTEPARNDFLMSQDMADTVKYILRSDNSLQKVIDDLGLIGISPKDISNNLTVTQYNETPVLEFSLSWRSAEEGKQIVGKLLDVSSDILHETLKTGTISVVGEPVARYIVGGHLNVPLWGIVALLGLVFGIAMSALDVMLRPTLIDLKDVQTEFQLETIGMIRKDDNYFSNADYMDSEKKNTGVMQDFSAAAYILKNRMGSKNKHQKIFVTSAGRREGKTTSVAHIAIQLAEMENKVLMVDFDTRNPELGPRFLKEVDFGHSLNALYRGEIEESEAITSINGYLDILPVVLEHNPIPLDGTVLDLINKISVNYDYVIMDTTSVGQFSDALNLNRIADYALLVVGFDMMQKTLIKDVIEKLDKSGIKILGCVVNKEKAVENAIVYSGDEKKKQKDTDSSISEIDRLVYENDKKSNKKKKKKKTEKDEEEHIVYRNILDEEAEMQTSETISDDDALSSLIEIGLSRKGEDDA